MPTPRRHKAARRDGPAPTGGAAPRRAATRRDGAPAGGPGARRARRLRAGVLAALLAALAAAAPAGAAVSPTTVLDPLGPDVLALGGTALADDGTGGAVWLHRVDGRPHVFAARFVRGAWTAPVRVDAGQPFASSWPVVAAGEGGRLLVAWVQEYGPGSDRLYSATLSPGASLFGVPAAIDLDVNEATGTQPSLAMNAGGNAVIAYRVITREREQDPSLPEGMQGAEIRMARYRGRRWSSLGRTNRNASIPLPEPAAGNGPKVGIGQDGNGVVAWVEDDNDLIPRVWARRVFASTLGAVLAASPATEDGAAAGPADTVDLGVGPFDDAAIAYRQHPGAAAAATATPRVGVAVLPQEFSTDAAAPSPLRTLAGVAPGGVPAVSVGDKETFRLGVPAAGGGVAGAASVKDGIGAAAPLGFGGAPVVSDGVDGMAATAWIAGDRVGVLQQLAADRARSGSLSAPAGGAVLALAGGADGLGDQLLAWRQGDGDSAAIAGAIVDAPPASFLAYAPSGWVRPGNVTLTWDPAADALGGITYTVLLDGQLAADADRYPGARLKAAGLDDGTYAVQIRATDRAGQERLSATARLRVDGTPPKVTARRLGGRLVELRIADAKGASGAVAGQTRISFGDGIRSKGTNTVRHRYAASKTYKVTALVADKAGNKAAVVVPVTVR
jgi:hypothetical protein